jgi:anaerobic magnesium-protoporphyrin IX monomethyl ester cyclase
MKVFLIRPPTYAHSLKFPQGPRFSLPLGLLYLAASLERNSIAVEIYDALVEGNFENPERNERGEYHIGASWEKIAEKIRSSDPDIVGINNPFSDFVDLAIKTAETAKGAKRGVITVVGGPHASSSPQTFFTSTSAVDYVLRGEAELTFAEFVGRIARGEPVDPVAGIAFRKGESLYINEKLAFVQDLDALPQPAFHLVDMERYFALVKMGFLSRLTFTYPGSEREVSIITSRGCPFMCCFCGNHLHMGRKWRKSSAATIIGQMALLVERYGVRHFHIEDDNLTLDIERFEGLLDEIIRRKWNITWDTPNGIRAEGLTPEIVAKVKESGCTYLIVGIESGNQRVLDTIVKKRLSLTAITEAARICKKQRVNLHGFYIIGFPGETVADLHSTLRFALRLLVKYDVAPHLSLARPLPGTELYDTCEKHGYFSEPVKPEIGSALKSEVFARVMIKTDDFTPALLERLSRSFNRRVSYVIVRKLAFFCLLHPMIFCTEILFKVKWSPSGIIASVKQLVFNRLLFKYCFLSDAVRRARR